MSNILIKNMDMPKEGRLVLAICPNGHIYRYYGDKPIPRGYGNYGIEAKQEALIKSDAVALPPHGRLVDADKLKCKTHVGGDCAVLDEVILVSDLESAPTILEASK